MSEKFYIKRVSNQDINGEYVNMTIRVTTSMRNAFDELASASNQSRNSIIINALDYALDHLEIVEDKKH